MTVSPPLVSYILVNWRTERDLPAALASIASQTHPHREVIVVDNGSENFDPALLAPFAPVTLIRNDRNLGFAAANNQGIAAASGEIVVLLNCDARLEPGFTTSAVETFSAGERVGTVVPKLLVDDGSGRIESCGHVMRLDRTTAHRGYHEMDRGQWDVGGFVFGGSAAAIAYRAATLSDIASAGTAEGGRPQVFDESFFAYFEDVDLDWRAQLAGWQAYYNPDCVAWHRAHGSGGRRNWLIQVRAEKNRYLMLLKNDSRSAAWGAGTAILAYELYHFLRMLPRPHSLPGGFALLLRELSAALRKRRLQRVMVRRGTVAARFTDRDVPSIPVAGLPDGTAPAIQPGLVSVIVVNYNGANVTLRCLSSLRTQTVPLEVIVVDNGSASTDLQELSAGLSGERLVALNNNLGFTGGVNWGAAVAHGEYIALVNNDTVLRHDCISELLRSLEAAGAAAVSGRLINVRSVDGPALEFLSTLDVTNSSPDLRLAIATSRRNDGLSLHLYPVPDLYGSDLRCFYPSGGLCLLRRAAVECLLPELVPQRYFAYYEDVWLGLALRAMGHEIVKAPDAVALHEMGYTARSLGSARLAMLRERNRRLTFCVCYPWAALLKLSPLLLLTGTAALLRALFSSPAQLLGQLLACGWILLHLPTVLRWRRRWSRCQVVPAARWLRELSGGIRGRGGPANAASIAWCRLLRVCCRETCPPESRNA